MKNNHGFTLLEIVIYIGLLGILLVVMSQVFIAILGTKLNSDSSAGVAQDGAYMLARLSYDIHRAARIVSPNLGASSSTLVLEATDSGVLRTYTYALTDGLLTLSDGINTDRINGGGTTISQFSVTRIGNSDIIPDAKDTLKIALTEESTYTRSSGIETMVFQTTIGLR